ncbi:MAG: hypothetical protein ABIB71_01805 [Candidatus Woesearchaeota archaeon]
MKTSRIDIAMKVLTALVFSAAAYMIILKVMGNSPTTFEIILVLIFGLLLSQANLYYKFSKMEDSFSDFAALIRNILGKIANDLEQANSSFDKNKGVGKSPSKKTLPLSRDHESGPSLN